jgi:hypothetical protein
LFIACKELLASLAGVDRASPTGQLGIVEVVLQTMNSQCSGLRAFYTEQAGHLDGSRPLAELRRVVDEYQVREDVRSALGFGQDTSRHELAPMQHLQGAEKEPRERTSRGCWHCGEMVHHAWKCPLPEDWKKFWCKYYHTKKWETEGFAKMPAELRKRYVKQDGGRRTIVGERMASGESKPSAPRRSGR